MICNCVLYLSQSAHKSDFNKKKWESADDVSKTYLFMLFLKVYSIFQRL